MTKKIASLADILAKHSAGHVGNARRAHGVISSGYASLDRILGGGFPRGQMTEIVGDSRAGKTTLLLRMVAEAQKRGEKAVWIDVEQSFPFDPEGGSSLAEGCGVNLDELIYANPMYAEEVTEMVLDFLPIEEVTMIVIDSIGAMNPKKRLEDEVGRVGQPALRARAVSELMERSIGPMAYYNTPILAVNHKTGLLQSDFYGNQKTTSKGGRTYNYLKRSAIHLKASKVEMIDGQPFAVEVTVTVEKSNRSPEGATTTLLNILGQGFSAEDDLIEEGLYRGVIEKSGNWLEFGPIKTNGRAKFLQALQQDPEATALLRDTVESVTK